MSDHAALLGEAPLFELFDNAERLGLARRLEARRLSEGEALFSCGDPGDVLYLVRRGRVRLSLQNQVGETVVLSEPSAGDVFGEVSMLDGGPRTADAVALEDTELLALGRDDLLAFLREHPHAALDLLAVMSRRLREADDVVRRSVTRNLNEEHIEQMSLGERIADRVAAFGGSWTFILVFGGVLAGWMTVNVLLLVERPFDPYPFILLNLVLSTVAALQAPVIMMSQNRQSAKDRLKADLDYEVNLKAELEVASLHVKVDRIYEVLQAHLARSDPGRADVGGRASESA